MATSHALRLGLFVAAVGAVSACDQGATVTSTRMQSVNNSNVEAAPAPVTTPAPAVGSPSSGGPQQPAAAAVTAVSAAVTPATQTATTAGTAAAAPTTPPAPAVINNVMEITVNGTLCGPVQYQYSNEPCVAVTICQHGTTTCQTIDNILLDTGSEGLRLFSSVVTIPTTPVLAASGGDLAECVSYLGAESQWGYVAQVDVVLGGEPAVQAPIQIIKSNFATPPGPCSSAQSTLATTPQQSGFNGILGVGILVQDCGLACTQEANNNMYFSCTGNNCTSTKTTLQVQNPVALLPTDNNGLLMQFASVPAGGTANASGTLIFGIGTQPNNTPPPTVTTLATDAYGEITTTYGAGLYGSFIDSGSNTMITPEAANLPACTGSAAGYLCPLTVQSLTATNYGVPPGGAAGGTPAAGAAKVATTFTIGNASELVQSNNVVFGDISAILQPGGNNVAADIDWGIPFFFGRSIYFGFDQAKSSLATGPYYAY